MVAGFVVAFLCEFATIALNPAQSRTHMARLKKTVSKVPRAQQAAPVAQTKAAPERPDYLFYAVPPVILLAIFAYCAKNSRPLPAPTPIVVAAASTNTAAKTPANKQVSTDPEELVIPPDVNNDLPDYVIPAGQKNVLAGSEATQSGFAKKFPAQQALDGSTKNDAKVAIAEAAGGRPAWWQADLAGNGAAVNSVVVYGGGSANPAGKLLGGFRVELEDAQGETLSREFHEMGFALEGYEEWKLDAAFNLKTIRVSALNSRSPIILREVLAVGAAQ